MHITVPHIQYITIHNTKCHPTMLSSKPSYHPATRSNLGFPHISNIPISTQNIITQAEDRDPNPEGPLRTHPAHTITDYYPMCLFFSYSAGLYDMILYSTLLHPTLPVGPQIPVHTIHHPKNHTVFHPQEGKDIIATVTNFTLNIDH